MDKNLKAFVIMPFDAEFDSIYEELIMPALEDAGYDISRADNILDQQNILCDIVRGIANADLVIADLTSLNSNVLYELGLCHGLRIPTILLTQSMEEVPFDLRPYRIQIYSTRFDEARNLKQALQQIADKHRKREIAFGSPITDFLSPGHQVLMVKDTHIPTKQLTEGAEEDAEERGFLDFLVEGNEAAEELTHSLIEITEETKNVAVRITGHTARLQDLTKRQSPQIAAEARKIAVMVAVDITDYSVSIEKNLPRLSNSTDVITDSFFSYITKIEPESKEGRERIAELRQSLSVLLEGTKSALQNMRSFRDNVVALKGFSREMNRSSRRLAGTLDKVIGTLEQIEAFCARTMPLIDEKLEVN